MSMNEDIKKYGQNSEYIDVTDPQDMEDWIDKRQARDREHQMETDVTPENASLEQE